MAYTVYAQEIDLVSEIVENNALESDQKNQTKPVKIETQADEKVADDRGIFSFLNFSFIKKPFSSLSDEEDNQTSASDQTTAEPVVKETPLQRKIRKAAAGSLQDQLNLGYMYLYGENGVEANYEEAFKYYEMAAAQKDPIALNNLGSLYFNGIGTAQNYAKAIELFALAAENGSDDAAVNLAFIYLSGNSKNKMLKEAVELFTQAAQHGNNTAKFMLGYAYYKGFQVEQNFHKAIELIKESAAAKFDEGEYVLALMYLNGQGIAQNYGNAVKYMKNAAFQGNLQATVHLANILTEGVVYPRNLIQAHILYNIAAIYNTPQAAQKRDAIKDKLKIEELLNAQSEAENFKANPSELTTYTRQTFGNNVRRYIDENITLR